MIKTLTELLEFIERLGDESAESLCEIPKEYLQYLYGVDYGRNRALFLPTLLADDIEMNDETDEWASTHLIDLDERTFRSVEELDRFLGDNEYEGTSYFDGDGQDFITAVIGIDRHTSRVVYEFGKMIEYMMKRDDSKDEEEAYSSAEEWIDFNTVRSLPYFHLSPIIISKEQTDYIKE